MNAQVAQKTTSICRTTLPVYSLGCGGGDALALERDLRRIPGVRNVYVNPATEMAYVQYDAAEVDASALAAAIAQAGFGPSRLRRTPSEVSAPLPRAEAALRLDSRRWMLAGGLWLAAIYALCVVAYLLVPQVFHVVAFWETMFASLNWPEVWILLLGLVAAFGYGALGAWSLALAYNVLPQRR